jgi:alkane 1-monooxygenase
VPDAPQLPASYPAMMLLALVPPLFSAVMDPRALAFSGASPSRSSDASNSSSAAAATATK